MGEGHLLEALIIVALSKGVSAEDLPLDSLAGIEMQAQFIPRFLDRIKLKYDIDLNPSQFLSADVFAIEHWQEKFDILFGNPPWATFQELPETDKPYYKQLFNDHGLLGDRRKLLLGDSRMELASLVLQKSIGHFLKKSGEAIFYLPLSLFMNEGANSNFRKYTSAGNSYALKNIYDLESTKAFPGVSTRNCLAHFQKGKKTKYPIDFFECIENEWLCRKAQPIFEENCSLSVSSEINAAIQKFIPIQITSNSTPRQGINTCGANHLFFFTEAKELQDELFLLSNSKIQNAILPKAFIYPLMSSDNFAGKTEVSKYVFLPYSEKGKPLSPEQIEEYPILKNYLDEKCDELCMRKGTMIQSWVRRGYYWALLGVGPYNFAKYKIAWESYGRSTFHPVFISGTWQMNQSLQCYMPFSRKREAEKILRQLKNPVIEEYLLSQKMAGTMNWAQPGKIKRLLDISD